MRTPAAVAPVVGKPRVFCLRYHDEARRLNLTKRLVPKFCNGQSKSKFSKTWESLNFPRLCSRLDWGWISGFHNFLNEIDTSSFFTTAIFAQSDKISIGSGPIDFGGGSDGRPPFLPSPRTPSKDHR